MTLDELNKEIEAGANEMTAEVIFTLWHRIEQRQDVDLGDYIALINIYAHARIYEHKLNVATRDYSMYDVGTGESYVGYNRQLRNLWKIKQAILSMNDRKHEMRDILRAKGIAFKQFHPSFHKLDMSRLPALST